MVPRHANVTTPRGAAVRKVELTNTSLEGAFAMVVADVERLTASPTTPPRGRLTIATGVTEPHRPAGVLGSRPSPKAWASRTLCLALTGGAFLCSIQLHASFSPSFFSI
jgi:hypothetical protein